jgi:hypothetical protein
MLLMTADRALVQSALLPTGNPSLLVQCRATHTHTHGVKSDRHRPKTTVSGVTYRKTFDIWEDSCRAPTFGMRVC